MTQTPFFKLSYHKKIIEKGNILWDIFFLFLFGFILNLIYLGDYKKASIRSYSLLGPLGVWLHERWTLDVITNLFNESRLEIFCLICLLDFHFEQVILYLHYFGTYLFSIKTSWLLYTFAGDGQASEYSCKATYRDTLSENSCWEKSLLDWEAQDHRTTYSCSCKECQSWGLCGKWCIIFYFHDWIPLKMH